MNIAKLNTGLEIATKATGLVGTVAWVAMTVLMLAPEAKAMWQEHKKKKWEKVYQEGLDDGKQHNKIEIERLTRENRKLYEESLRVSEGTAE